ncbi:MAG: right-handed parallel beta-helix repeat-containing protein, partial [Patescibacteria group bacterium]|nr:right-handed parallel beta-helix repeat-containing protein [Patescibacteria group bacterium]
MFLSFKKKGFTLIDALVGIFLILIVFLGIFGAYQLGIKVVGLSKNRISALALANQEMEKLKNLDYPEVVSYSTSTELNKVKYEINVIVQCIDDKADGKAPNDENNCVCDYKKVKIKVSWPGLFSGKVELLNIISPRNKTEECQVPAGVLAISVFDAKGAAVDSPSIEVRDINTGQQYFGNLVGPGQYEFVLPPATSTYMATTTKLGYTLSKTFRSGEVYNGQTIANPENACYAQPIITILNAQREERSFCIDKVSKFLIQTLQAKAKHIYYVRKVGSDDNDGLSPDTAFLTIQKAASTTQAGDIVFVGAGDYEEKVIIYNSGAVKEPIAFVADTEGIYTGDSGEVKISRKEFGFYINNEKYIKIYGFKISNTTGTAAIYITGSVAGNIELINNAISNNTGDGVRVESVSDITISHNFISSNAQGIYLNKANSTEIIKNKIFQNSSQGISNQSSNQVKIKWNEVFSNGGIGILVFDNANNNEISNNIVYLNSDDGIQIFDHASSIKVIENKSYSNSGSGIVFKKNVTNGNLITSNLVYSNEKSGILLSDKCVNNTLNNNTSYFNQVSGISIELGSTNNELKDNIVAKNAGAGIKVSGSPNVKSSYSDVWGNSPDYEGIKAGEGSISLDPLFVDPDGPDNILGGNNGKDDSFHLSQIAAGQAENSPCVDAGSDDAEEIELDDQTMEDLTTRTDNVTDSEIVDMGFHYSLESPPSLPPPPDPFGLAIPNTTFHLRGEKMVGRDAANEPIYKYSATSTTDDEGKLTLTDMEWDDYYFSDFSAAGEDLELIISYPSLMPIYLAPDSTTTVKLGLKGENFLLVRVIDAASSEPIAFATVRLYKTGYDETKITDENGETYFIPLAIGSYNIEAWAPNYATSTVSVNIQKGENEK